MKTIEIENAVLFLLQEKKGLKFLLHKEKTLDYVKPTVLRGHNICQKMS